MKKSQVAMEYVALLGVGALLTLVLVIVYFQFTSDSGNEILYSQVDQIATQIVDAAESVYILGAPSQTVIKVRMPSGVESTNHIVGNPASKEIVFVIKTTDGDSEIVGVSSVDLIADPAAPAGSTGGLPAKKPGLFQIILTARGAPDNDVTISYK